jgi:signal transduction histidine kinase
MVDLIGVHLARLQLLAEGQRAGAQAERARLAGDIHDTIAQDLAGVTTHLEAAASAIPVRHAVTEQHLAAAAATARSALAELRGLVWALRPASRRLPLAEAIRRHAERTAAESGVAIATRLEDVLDDLLPEAELCMLRAAQEGLRNAIRHGAPRHIDLVLARSDDTIELAIVDDGTGFEPASEAAAPEGGHGLATMRERVRRLSGVVDVASTPGGGSRLTLRLPRRRGGGPR